MASKNMESSSLVRMKSASHDYQFEVNYHKSKDLPMGEYVASPTFNFEGYEWAIHYYPQYKGKNDQFFSLNLLSKAAGVWAEFSLNLLNKNETSIVILPTLPYTFIGDGKIYGKIIPRNEVKAFMGIDGIFIISCKIRVLSGPRNVVNISSGGLHEHMEKLLNMNDKFDVTFEVEGKKIPAHRLILAARSPVFAAELFGSMSEVDMKCIRIEDMKANVFMAMLRFMYTDQISSGGSGDLSKLSFELELVQDLFVAADRYALDKLKEICEEILCNNLSVRTVATTLLLADRHSCPRLKEKCLRFASKPENFMQLALTEEYLHMIQASPFLLIELRKKVNNLSGMPPGEPSAENPNPNPVETTLLGSMAGGLRSPPPIIPPGPVVWQTCPTGPAPHSSPYLLPHLQFSPYAYMYPQYAYATPPGYCHPGMDTRV